MSQSTSNPPLTDPYDRRPRLVHDHNMSFLDHRGNQAIMSWQNNSEDPGLPHLWCWVFYFVNPEFNFSLEAFDGAKFKRGLFKDVAEGDNLRERLEFYYLPDATLMDCVEHYRAEVEKRGTVWEDLERLKQAQDGRAQDSPRKGLPGLVPQYVSAEDEMCTYQGAIFMSEDADWDAEHHERNLCVVQFDPVPQHFGPDEKVYFDPMENPVHPEWMDAIAGVTAWIENCRRSDCPNEFLSTIDANTEASSLGWNSW